jgi:DNA-binding CsgD family transcriptional regulator
VFEILGVDPLDERAYRTLLVAAGPVTEAALAKRLGEPRGEVRRAVLRLEERGMVQRLAGAAAELVAVPPDVALDALLAEQEEDLKRREAELRRARAAATGLHEELRRNRLREPVDVIELVSGRERVSRRANAILRTVRHEVMVTDTPPYPDEYQVGAANDVELELLSRNVVCRALYDVAACETPGVVAHVLTMAKAGEQARVVPELPLKALIADRSIAVLPLSAGSFLAAGDGALVVHPSSLLDALVALFEALWRVGSPIAPGVDAGETGEHLDLELLGMLAGGLKDEAIARQLGISVRTLGRRMNDLMVRLGASTRFQAGLQARGRGLI